LGIKTTPLYMAPEITKDLKATSPKLDMWALGIIFYQLVSSNEYPFNN